MSRNGWRKSTSISRKCSSSENRWGVFRISTLQHHHYITSCYTYQFLKKVILGSSLQYRFSKIIPPLFVDKASCTRQFESELSLHSLALLFPIKKGFFSTSPSLLQGKTFFRKPTRPSLPLKKAFFYLSVSPARRAPLSPQAPLPQEAGM